MATSKNVPHSGVIGMIFKLAGTLVGNAMITVKRIFGATTPLSKGSSGKPIKKASRAAAKTKKKTVRKTTAKASKTKKKAVTKQKPKSSVSRGVTSKKKAAKPPIKIKTASKKAVSVSKKVNTSTPKKKTNHAKAVSAATENNASSIFQNYAIREIDSQTNVPSKKQEPQMQVPIAEIEVRDNKFNITNVSFEPGSEKSDITETDNFGGDLW